MSDTQAPDGPPIRPEHVDDVEDAAESMLTTGADVAMADAPPPDGGPGTGPDFVTDTDDLPDVAGEVEVVELTETTSGRLGGPMRVVTLVVAVGWLVLAGFSFWQLAPPAGFIVGGGALVGAAITGWLGLSLVLRWDVDGVILAGRGYTPWTEIDQVALHRGILSVPVVEIRRARAIETIPLDALAWFGQRVPLSLAQKVAERTGTPDVLVVERPRRRGRRGVGQS